MLEISLSWRESEKRVEKQVEIRWNLAMYCQCYTLCSMVAHDGPRKKKREAIIQPEIASHETLVSA